MNGKDNKLSKTHKELAKGGRLNDIEKQNLLNCMTSIDPIVQVMDIHHALGLEPHPDRKTMFMWPHLVAMLVLRIDAMQGEIDELKPTAPVRTTFP